MTIPVFCGEKNWQRQQQRQRLQLVALVEWMGACDSAAGHLFSGGIMADPAALSYVIYIAAPP
jgi:hypothetical protein